MITTTTVLMVNGPVGAPRRPTITILVPWTQQFGQAYQQFVNGGYGSQASGFPVGGGLPPMGGGFPALGGGLPPMGGGLPPLGGGLPPMGGGFGPAGGMPPIMGSPFGFGFTST
jgi:hypothetical protein